VWQQRLVCRHLTEFKTATTGPWRNRVFVGAAVSSRGVQEESSQVRVSWWCSVSTSGRPTSCSPAEVKVSSVIGVSSPPLLRRGVQEESSGSSSSYKFVSNIVSGRSLEQRVCPGGVDESSSVKGSRRRRGSVRATSPACETGLHLVVLSSSAVNLRSRRRRWSSRAVNTGRPAGPVQRPGFVGGGLRSQQQVLHRLRRETCQVRGLQVSWRCGVSTSGRPAPGTQLESSLYRMWRPDVSGTAVERKSPLESSLCLSSSFEPVVSGC